MYGFVVGFDEVTHAHMHKYVPVAAALDIAVQDEKGC